MDREEKSGVGTAAIYALRDIGRRGDMKGTLIKEESWPSIVPMTQACLTTQTLCDIDSPISSAYA